MPPDIPKEINVIEVRQPVGVIHKCHVTGDTGPLEKRRKLFFKALAVGIDILVAAHLAHFGFSAGITYPGGSPADENGGAVTRPGQVGHGEHGHHVPGVEAGPRGIGTDVEGYRSFLHSLLQRFQVGTLFEKASLGENFQSLIAHRTVSDMSAGRAPVAIAAGGGAAFAGSASSEICMYRHVYTRLYSLMAFLITTDSSLTGTLICSMLSR
jgi:hypothetical protein